MPPPMVVCSICGENVMKAQTAHVGDGKRACKKHDGVMEKKAELERQELLRKEREAQEAARRDEVYQNQELPRQNRCCLCHRVALTEREFWTKVMVAEQRLAIKGTKLSMLDPNFVALIKKELKLGDKTLITSLYSSQGNEASIKKMPQAIQGMVAMFGFISLCQDCAANLGFKREPPKDISFEELAEFGAVYDVLVKPVLRQVAVKQLREEGERN